MLYIAAAAVQFAESRSTGDVLQRRKPKLITAENLAARWQSCPDLFD